MRPESSILAMSLLCLTCCTKNFSSLPSDNTVPYPAGNGEIVLGKQLDNPYNIKNVKAAYHSLYGRDPGDDIQFTDWYVRFLPSDSGQMDELKAMGINLLDHPVDYEIIREGDWYHDPSLDDDSITWQYAVVPHDFVFPKGITCERLQQCFLAENSPASKAAGDIDWAALEHEAYRLSGNLAMLDEHSATKANDGISPSGRITIIDPDHNDGQPCGVSGVKVQCNVFVKFSSAYTDADGYYKIPKNFTAKPRYRLVFSNVKGFNLGFNSILYKGSVSNLGKASPAGLDLCVEGDSEDKLYRRCVVNNAAYDYYVACDADHMNIDAPPSGLCIWMFTDLKSSSAVMLHHGTVLPDSILNEYYLLAAWIVQLFGPDLTIGVQGQQSYKQMYASTIHELAHASHFSKVGIDYWNNVAYHILQAYSSGGDTYGGSEGERSGYCEIAEMWAYYMESRMYKQRYGGSNPMFGSSYWFHPQRLIYLESRGMKVSEIFAAMVPEVIDGESLRDKLIELYPSKRTNILQIFNRYE